MVWDADGTGKGGVFAFSPGISGIMRNSTKHI